MSCAPVLNEDLMKRGIYNFRLSEIKQNPESNTGRLFILGGIIVKTTVTKEGSLIEAIYAPVDSLGYLRGYETSAGRYLAIYRGKELLDPLIYSEKREITIAGEFIGTRKGHIEEMEYVYPLFEIKDIYLWQEYMGADYYPSYSPYPYYPPPYYTPYYYRHNPYYPDQPHYPGRRWWY
ncbi:MAG: hypothetical protein C4560_10230 [Nitrospiraceae bacterium]|nr:MAG: hypothetical protein C4560_10230 [Nitrospiraceae bacterium]